MEASAVEAFMAASEIFGVHEGFRDRGFRGDFGGYSSGHGYCDYGYDYCGYRNCFAY